jgi:uncharacterized OB-fold protein
MTRFDLPTPDPSTEPYWEGAARGVLLVKRCGSCGRAHFAPRPFCPHCWSDEVTWEEASGRATLYTYSIVRRNDLPPFADRIPYVAAIVDLEEGVRMTTEVVDCPLEKVEIGMALEVTFRAIDEELYAPVFRPAAAASD